MKTTKTWVELDGSHGEGGGQILRSALALAMITQTPFKIEKIRAKRQKPGLLRQHLTAVKAAQAICGATVEGAELGSTTLSFEPGPIKGGDYRFVIGTAGSCNLVLQTVLPALWFADAPSCVWVSGGTHNSAAPPADFLIHTWLPLMQKMGVNMQIELLRHGFYPAGGGEIKASVQPVAHLQRMDVLDRGEQQSLSARAIVAAVHNDVAKREVERIHTQINGVETRVHELPSREGPGNALVIEARHAHVTETITAFGERGISAEQVADKAVKELRHYLQSNAAVGEHLADQLVLPMALAGGGALSTVLISSHLQTNLDVIAKFLPVEATVTEMGKDCWRVEVG